MEVKSKIISPNVRTVQINYSTQQLEPSQSSQILNPGDAFRIIFKPSDINSFDLANTRLNFALTITRAISTADRVAFPLVLTDPCNLFQLQSIVWNGVQLTHTRGTQADSLYRKILRMLGSSRQDYITESVYNTVDEQTPFTAAAGQQATDTVYGVGQVRKLATDRYIAQQERARMETEVSKHYDLNQTAIGGLLPSFTQKTEVRFENRYSVSIAELGAELQMFKMVDRKLLGSGLELNFQMADPKFALQLVPRDGDAATLTNSLAYAAWNTLDTYQVTSTFLSIPQHIKTVQDIPDGLSSMIPSGYMTFAHNQQSVVAGASNLNYSWSVGHSSYCYGIVVCFAPKDFNTATAGGLTQNLNVTPHGYFNASELKKISLNYMYPMAFTEMQLQVGSDTYQAQSGPPIASREYSSWLQAKEHCLQIFGLEFMTSFEKYRTINFCHFIPIHKKLTQGELFQFYMSAAPGQAAYIGANDLQAHFFTVLGNTISFDGNNVKVE